MKLILDTHIVLWWRLDSPRLSAAIRRAIATSDLVWVSAASGWEVAIKRTLGKLRLADAFSEMVADSQFEELPVTLRHTEALMGLPTHHTDPFDRMLIAQAQTEAATIVTHDQQFRSYDVRVLWV